jgi:hypothetical protein
MVSTFETRRVARFEIPRVSSTGREPDLAAPLLIGDEVGRSDENEEIKTDCLISVVNIE